jgi:hypothetical protein
METEVCSTATKAVEQCMNHVVDTLRSFTKTSEVGDLAITRDQALAIYNQIATKCGQPNLDTVGAIYQVEVNWNDGTTIMVVEEVEADSEEEAVEIVQDGFSINGADLSLSLSFGANSGTETIYGLDWELDSLINESLEFRATEL